MTDFAAFSILAWPLLMGLAAVGAVLFIKIVRRRQATQDPRHTDAVPARPLSHGDAWKMTRRYVWAVVLTLAGIGLIGLLLLRPA